MVESATIRKRKRVVDHTLTGFKSANEAIIFGNTVEMIINDKIGSQKFRQQIGSPDTKLAITNEYNGETVLKTKFLEIKNQNTAKAICEQLKEAVKAHNEVHHASVKAEEIIRGKPQPQYVIG